MKKNTTLLIFILLYSFQLISQNQIFINVKNSDGNNLKNSIIHLTPAVNYSINVSNGLYQLSNIPNGNYKLSLTHLGFKDIHEAITINNKDLELSYILEDDLLNLETVIITGNFSPKSKLQSSTSVSTLHKNNLSKIAPRGTAQILQTVSGMFTDASAGEVFTRVYTRGVSASAEDDMGWYYISLQEDGLPISLIQHSYYAPDIFYRNDITTTKLEAIRGGKTSITSMNAPGGIFNFISNGKRNALGGEIQLQSGVQNNNNMLYRIDATIGSPLGNSWFFNAGGHYRHDDGARNTNFTFSKGGQLKFNLRKENDNGYFKFYGKFLNDKTNRYTGVAARNWNDPTPAFGQNFNSMALMMPEFKTKIPDGRNLTSSNTFNPAQGVHAKDYAFGLDLFQDLNNSWSIKNNIKFSAKIANWQTSISNAFVSLNNPLAYFITGAQFPVGEVVFRDTQSGSEIARIDNSGILSGESFLYLTDGRLPNDAIMGTSTWLKNNTADELIQQLTLSKQLKSHNLDFGLASGFSKTSVFTQGSFGFVTYDTNPKMLFVTLENPDQPVVTLSDENGISNYGGLFFGNSRANITQLAAFANDSWDLTNKLNLDFGLRFESITHKGSNDRYEPFSQEGGLDENPLTDYDNGILTPSGEIDEFNSTYNYISYSAGINYKSSNHTALFGRYSKGNKAPELNYYFNNFSNVPINEKGEIQKIHQIEIGLKSSLKHISVAGTLFYSQLENIGSSNFEFDNANNSIFYTPIQFNSSETFGLEWESVYAPINNLRFIFNGTLQNPKTKSWTLYEASGTADAADDSITDYSGNTLPFNPKLMFNMTTEYNLKAFSSFMTWHFMGKREANVANAFQLPAYSIFDLGLEYKITKNMTASLLITNLFNSEGLANFYGINSFGASANGTTKSYIEENPDASFIVVPVLPWGSILKLSYTF
ncbi:TonB-dependent receptor [Aestuariibaculum suncheonense]|uniref:TonB-dependent receptor n=1 Tax=Aestuariibaculum suncheonense TaxID=1028745 RepID=A0A8J6Q9P2_9FLAO|nr:TonB-dependent receptor [Aestuariibaculum suncheonense]MBD0836201.1 TonB-dependent receptor [Aestuariibaculum suncheonense]